MILVIHDGDKKFENKIRESLVGLGEIEFITEDSPILQCIGCFGCWIKTPMKCVLNDDYSDTPSKLAKADEVIIISRCCYGTYSPFVKNVFDRSIGYMDPDFTKVDGEMHHKNRYDKWLDLSVYFYGNISDREKSTAQRLVEANLINLHAKLKKIGFYKSLDEIKIGEDD